jgi:predicted dehydrogenase
MKKVGLGIIGLGYIGKLHLRHVLKMPSVDFVAASDLSEKALNEAKNSGITNTFTNYEDLLRESEIDAVIVALPTHLHLQCAVQAAEAGKHIFLEKPIARNPEEAREIVAIAQRNSVKLMMGYHLRFNHSFRELKTRMERGELGEVEVAYATFVSSGPFFHRGGHTPVRVPEWWFNKELTGGGALIDVGSHVINLLRWYFGEVIDIKACFGHRFNLDFEDSAICFSKFESGTSAVITAGYFSQGFKLEVEFFGTVDHAFAQHRPGNRLIAAAQMLTTGRSNFYQAHFDELKYFVNCLTNDLSPSPSGQDGLKDIEAISLAYKNELHFDER